MSYLETVHHGIVQFHHCKILPQWCVTFGIQTNVLSYHLILKTDTRVHLTSSALLILKSLYLLLAAFLCRTFSPDHCIALLSPYRGPIDSFSSFTNDSELQSGKRGKPLTSLALWLKLAWEERRKENSGYPLVKNTHVPKFGNVQSFPEQN